MATKEVRTTPLTQEELDLLWAAQLKYTAKVLTEAVAHNSSADDTGDDITSALDVAILLQTCNGNDCGGPELLQKVLQMPYYYDPKEGATLAEDRGLHTNGEGGICKELEEAWHQWHTEECEDDETCASHDSPYTRPAVLCQCDNPINHIQTDSIGTPICGSRAVTALAHPEPDFPALLVCVPCIAHQDDEYVVFIGGTNAEG